jgi:hypothetical protein
MSWDDARLLKLSESMHVEDCLRAIIAYHTSINGMRDEQKNVFVLGIDEINQLVFSRDGGVCEISALKALTRALQSLSPPSGLSPLCWLERT